MTGENRFTIDEWLAVLDMNVDEIRVRPLQEAINNYGQGKYWENYG